MAEKTLEDLLNEQEERNNNRIKRITNPQRLKIYVEHPEDNKILRANGNTDIFGLIKMIEKIVTITMKDLEVKFIPDEEKVPIVNPDIHLDHPYITFQTISRKPKNNDGFKPRFRQQLVDKDGRVGEIFGQKFEAIIQFDIFASVYDIAEQVMKRFEEQIFTYTGFFKENGVSEIFLKQQLKDDNLEQYRQHLSIRSLQYYVEIETLIPVFHNKIAEISFTDSIKNESEE